MCLAAMVIPFLPATNIFFRVGFVIAERVLYLPSVGFCLLIIVGLRQLAMFHRAHWVRHQFLVIVFCYFSDNIFSHG
jgi:hypothetical protein